MKLDTYYRIKYAKKGKSSTAEDFSTQNASALSKLWAGANLPLGFRKPTKDDYSLMNVVDKRSLGDKYDQAQNAGLAMALGYGGEGRRLRQALAAGGIGLGAVGGGVGGFYGGRALADLAGLDADASIGKRIGRYALMGGGTLGGAALGGSLAAAGVGAGLGDYNSEDAMYAKNIANNADMYARKIRGEGKGIVGNALLNAKRRLGEGMSLAAIDRRVPKQIGELSDGKPQLDLSFF